MNNDDLQREIKDLVHDLVARFDSFDLIPGCQVVGVTDKDQYATNNGWIEAICGAHNRQRVRWKGSPSPIGTTSYVDVIYFKSRRLFECYGAGGTAVMGVPMSSSLFTAKGDILTATAAATPATLGVGTDGQHIIAASGQAEGIDWSNVVDLDGVADALIIDADADTTISAPTDDQIDIEIAGADDFTFTANVFTALSGSQVQTDTINETTAAAGVTIDGVLLKDTTVDVNGTADAIILDADADTTISAPTDDEIDIEVGGADVAEFKAGGLYLASGTDVFANGLSIGLSATAIDLRQSINTSAAAIAAGVSWAAYTGFTTPGNISTADIPDHLTVWNATASKHFGYFGSYSANQGAVVEPGRVGTIVTGIRMDDGTNSNYSMLVVVTTPDATVQYQIIYSVGGSVTTTVLFGTGSDWLPQRLALFQSRSGDVVYNYIGFNTYYTKYVGAAVITGWTPSRNGIYHEQGGVGSDTQSASIYRGMVL